MKILNSKGQANVVPQVVGLFLIVVVVSVAIRIHSNVMDNLALASTTRAIAVTGNFSDSTNDTFQMLSVSPLIIGATILIGLVMALLVLRAR